ncbi:hypothetical protein HY030_04560 [Candidatus Gottesmanbacteria bacterium]|nr:hypothetical protein [Candidatus Gottesmanbacteria bacterium]
MSPIKRKELMIALCCAIATLNKPDEVAEFLLDFLSPKENEMIAKRLRIAELLVRGNNYESIRIDVGAGYSTIARVNTWLNLSGKGLKLVLERKKSEPKEATIEEKYDPYSWHNAKRRLSIYFWPELLIEELLKTSNNLEKEKIKNIFEKLNLKSKTFDRSRNKDFYLNFRKHLE